MKNKICENDYPRPSVVDVYFPQRRMTLPYYNDTFELECGDVVYVDGKLERLRGEVVNVSYTFKINLSVYKKVIAAFRPQFRGDFYAEGNYMVSSDNGIPDYEDMILWFRAPMETEYAVGRGYDGFALDDLSKMGIDEKRAQRGQSCYKEGGVKYLSLKETHGRAIVCGSDVYEIEFTYEDGIIKNLTCSCFCTDNCKHEYAAMLLLKEILGKRNVETVYGKYFTAIEKKTFSQMLFCGNMRKIRVFL